MGLEKNEINAILNSVEVKVEVCVELGNLKKKMQSKSAYFSPIPPSPCDYSSPPMFPFKYTVVASSLENHDMVAC